MKLFFRPPGAFHMIPNGALPIIGANFPTGPWPCPKPFQTFQMIILPFGLLFFLIFLETISGTLSIIFFEGECLDLDFVHCIQSPFDEGPLNPSITLYSLTSKGWIYMVWFSPNDQSRFVGSLPDWNPDITVRLLHYVRSAFLWENIIVLIVCSHSEAPSLQWLHSIW